MKKLSPNTPCPCGSSLKYKRCCRPYHLGKRPPDALTLMKSRYSAYAAGEVDYIIRTTHPEHPDRARDPGLWREEILAFCRHTRFLSLTILRSDTRGGEAAVCFVARFAEGSLEECSRFLFYEGRWLYRGTISADRSETSLLSGAFQ